MVMRRPTRKITRKIKITPKMLRAGVDAYLRWDKDQEEVEALAAEIFFLHDGEKVIVLIPV
jgi:hypothetical protein